MKEVSVGPNDVGLRIDKFLSKAVPSLPKSLLYKYIRLGRVKIENKKVTISRRLKLGESLQLYINDEFFEEKQNNFLAAPTAVSILYEDQDLLLADKQVGLVVHEDESGTTDTLIGRIQHLLYNRGEYNPAQEQSFAPALCNRIDRNTGGIVLAAKNAPALRFLDEKIKNREIKKHYLCLVHGHLKEKKNTLTFFLIKNESEKKVRVYEHPVPQGLKAITKYQVLDENKNLSLLEVELITGRTHQIRASLAYIGHPLLGDGKYGSNALNKPYNLRHQALYAYSITFAFMETGPLSPTLSERTFTVPNIWFAKNKKIFLKNKKIR